MTVASPIDLMNLTPFAAGTDDTLFTQLRDHDPLHWNDEPDGPGFWSVTRYADVKAVAADAETFTVTHGTQIPSRRAEGEGARSIHHLDPPDHTKLRGLVTPSVRPVKLKGLEGDITAVIDTLLDDAQGHDRIDFVSVVAARLPLVMIGRLLGAPLEDCPNLLRWTNQIASEDPDYSEGPETAVRARGEVFDYFRGLETLRRECPADDLVSVLAAAELDGVPLTRGYLDAYYLLLMVAGNETTRNLLSGGVHVLAEHRQWWEYMRANPHKIRVVVDELVRWLTPVISMRRTATRDVTMHGKTIAAGDKVVMWFCSANRDERVFDDPCTFDGRRFPNEHLGFGWGAHVCLGSNLAKLEAKLFFTRVIERGLDIEVLEQPDRLHSNLFRGIKTLPVSVRDHR